MFYAMNARKSNILNSHVYGLRGGLTLMHNHLAAICCYELYRVDFIVFMDNTARFGAGALLGILYVLDATAILSNCALL